MRTFALSPIARQLIPALHASIAAHWDVQHRLVDVFSNRVEGPRRPETSRVMSAVYPRHSAPASMRINSRGATNASFSLVVQSRRVPPAADDGRVPEVKQTLAHAVRLERRLEFVLVNAAASALRGDRGGAHHLRVRVAAHRVGAAKAIDLRVVPCERTSGWSSKASEAELKGVAGGD